MFLQINGNSKMFLQINGLWSKYNYTKSGNFVSIDKSANQSSVLTWLLDKQFVCY